MQLSILFCDITNRRQSKYQQCWFHRKNYRYAKMTDVLKWFVDIHRENIGYTKCRDGS